MPKRSTVEAIMAAKGCSRTAANNSLRKRGTNPDFKKAMVLSSSQKQTDRDLVKGMLVEVKLKGKKYNPETQRDEVSFYSKKIVPKRRSIAK